MKYHLIIDKDKEEEIIITCHEKNEMIEKIEKILDINNYKINGYCTEPIEFGVLTFKLRNIDDFDVNIAQYVIFIGTSRFDGVLEKNLNLEMALILGELLAENGYAVMYTRTEDALLYRPEENIKGMRKIYDLKNRAAFAEAHPEAIFVSLHMNAFGDARYSGLQVYYNVNDNGSEALARAVQDEVVLQLQPENHRKVKSGKDMYLMENIASPSILVECGFLSNAEECEKLSQKEYQKRLCFAILCGIIKYDSTRK